jgi:hypothetical protein
MDSNNRISLGCLKIWIPLLFLVAIVSVGAEPFATYGIQKIRGNLSESGVTLDYGTLRATPFSITLGSVVVSRPSAGVTEIIDDLVVVPEWTSLLRLAPAVQIHARYLGGSVDGTTTFSLKGQIRHAYVAFSELHLTSSGTIHSLNLEDGIASGTLEVVDPHGCTGSQNCLQAHVDITHLRKASETTLPIQGSPLGALLGQRMISAIPLPRLQEGSLLLDLQSQPTATAIRSFDVTLDTFRLVLKGSIAAPLWPRRPKTWGMPGTNLAGSLKADASVTTLLGQWGGLIGIRGKPLPDVETPLIITGQLNQPHIEFSPTK